MSFNRLVSLSLACLLSACTSGMRDGQRQQSAAAVDRIYVIDCGENHAKDGSAVIKATPGHTPGHQSLFVRLPKTGPVLLSGDFVHLRSNWEAKRVPSINFNVEQSSRSMLEMESFIKATGAQLWINHDAEQSRAIPKAPAFVE